uniref:ATP synthase protein I, sodium ion specific n=2 Tax=Propionigenium modestum TaxID=2333 RepID=ATPZ_PROMO|nr:RecName: Full=ATP synthase protein I, sodium ion specific [Propionigenium modestum]AAA09660.1 sodium-translocating ATPase F0 alpha subunit [Propionigenium modestum]CAA41367.1 F1 subunit [Propionigenium modestum]CAA46893.1 ATPase i-gen subunit [Propionigenium modestum]
MNQEIKKILKNSLITSLIVLVYGIVVRNPIVYFGMFVGCLISTFCFYMICQEAESAMKSGSPFKMTVTGYMKRYAIYGIYLGILVKFFGFPVFLGGAVGLLNIKFNIFLKVVSTQFEKIKKKLSSLK